MAICHCYVEQAVSLADHSEVKRLAIDETSRAKGHDYVTLAADAERRAVLFVAAGAVAFIGKDKLFDEVVLLVRAAVTLKQWVWDGSATDTGAA